MPQFILNPFTGKFDAVRNVGDTSTKVCLNEDCTTYIAFDGNTTVSVVINGTLAHPFTVSNTHEAGEPVGLLLSLTYPTAGA